MKPWTWSLLHFLVASCKNLVLNNKGLLKKCCTCSEQPTSMSLPGATPITTVSLIHVTTNS